jgi:DNA polymerase III subunit epsilon
MSLEERNNPMLENDLTLAAMAEALAKSADYRVLRRLVPRTTFPPSIGQSTKTGVLFDVETTGLDQAKDEVIELGMVKFDYMPDGRIVGIKSVFSSFNEPSEPIPPEVTALTGITNEMVARQRIDDAAVFSFVDDSVTTRASTANSLNATGRYSDERLGGVRPPRSSGGSTASKARAWATC